METLKWSHSSVYVFQMIWNFVRDFLQLYSYLHFYFNQKLSWSAWRPPTELVCVFKRFVYHPEWYSIIGDWFILVQGHIIVLIELTHQRKELKGFDENFPPETQVAESMSNPFLTPFVTFLSFLVLKHDNSSIWVFWGFLFYITCCERIFPGSASGLPLILWC